MKFMQRFVSLIVFIAVFLIACTQSAQLPATLEPTKTPQAVVLPKMTPTALIEPTPEPIETDVGTIKIGFMGPLSGGAAFVGKEQLGFVKTVAKIFGEQTGLNIEIVEADTEINPAIGVVIAEQFVEDEAILAVIGPAGSQTCKETQPIFEAAGLAHITPSCTRTDLTDPGTHTFFRPIPTDADQSRTLAAHMIVANQIHSLYIVEDKSAYASLLSDELTLLLVDSGIRIRRFPVEPEQTDFSTIVEAVIAANADAVFMAAQIEEQNGALAIQLQQRGYQGKYYLPDSGFALGWVHTAGAAAEGAYISFFAPDPNLVPEAAPYNEVYMADYGSEFGAFGGAAGLTTQVLLKAVGECVRNAEVTRGCVLNKLRFTQMQSSMLGIPIKFGTGNQSEGGFSLFQIQNGKYQLLSGVGDPGIVKP